jgi:protein lysine acetyltransferase
VAEWIARRANELAHLTVFADCFPADLYALAAMIEPLHAEAGDVLMRQGDPSHGFLIIGDGRAVVRRHGDQRAAAVEISVEAGRIVGEIGMLRHSPRVASVIAAEELSGWVGGDDAFDQLIELPGVMTMLVRTARQRLAAFIAPIPFRLRDGTGLLLRPVLPGDAARAENGPVEFSSETLFRRFMTVHEPTPALMDYLFEVDYTNHFVWVVVDAGQDVGEGVGQGVGRGAGESRVVADARFVRDEHDAKVAEIAFIVGDEYQGRGVGSFLMKALVAAAHAGGVEKFTARILSDNHPMRAIVGKFGAEWQRDDLGVVSAVIDVPDLSAVSLPEVLIHDMVDSARRTMKAMS